MKKRILLPTDFSDNAWSAAVYVLKLYVDEVCEFYFLHALAQSSLLSRKTIETQQETAKHELIELKDMAELANANANHSFDIILSSDPLKSAIDEAIKKHHINLIVMGTLGATGSKALFFGSHTINIIQKIKSCPVLVVPQEYDYEVPTQLAFPTDFKRFYSEAELRSLKELASVFHSKIRIIHINVEEKLSEIQHYNRIKLNDYLANYIHSFHWIPNYTTKTKALNEFIRDLNINMLIMVHYKHSFIEKILKEPILKKIGFQPIIPFLVIPE